MRSPKIELLVVDVGVRSREGQSHIPVSYSLLILSVTAAVDDNYFLNLRTLCLHLLLKEDFRSKDTTKIHCEY